MNKACIFDFDGVIIDSESHWEGRKEEIYSSIYGAEISAKIGDTLGTNMEAIHERAKRLGSTLDIREAYAAFDAYAQKIYAEAPITEGLEPTLVSLDRMGFVMGIVSASPISWIHIALERIPHAQLFKTIISLQDHMDLKHKPAPDGYLEAMKNLDVSPNNTVIIEDSNTGVKSAKAAGVFTIGLKQNHESGYTIEGADAYVDAIIDVLRHTKEDYAKS